MDIYKAYPGQDIYILPFSESKNKNIVYSPLRRMAFSVDDHSLEKLSRYLSDGIDITDDPVLKNNIEHIRNKEFSKPKDVPLVSEDSIVILLSQRCNLACEYCFAKNAHASDRITRENLFGAIDYVINHGKSDQKGFVFLGGGEPLMEWDLFTDAVEYIEKNVGSDTKMRIKITTNATLLNEERVDYLKKHNVLVTVSSDILPEVQNAQRPMANGSNKDSFPYVNRSIELILEKDVDMYIRSTITEMNVKRMPEMVQYVHDHYPKLKMIQFEHMSAPGLGNSDYFEDFITYFFQACTLAEQYGLELKNTTYYSIRNRQPYFCKGEFCVTPTGNLTACHRVSSENDSLYPYFHFGTIQNDPPVDPVRLTNVKETIRDVPKACDDCFAKWHCAGGCRAEWYSYSEEDQKALCAFNRSLVRKSLEKQLIKQGMM